jgi:hypothetical protein
MSTPSTSGPPGATRCRRRECAAPILPRSPNCPSGRRTAYAGLDEDEESNERKLVPNRQPCAHDIGQFADDAPALSDRRVPCFERRRRTAACAMRTPPRRNTERRRSRACTAGGFRVVDRGCVGCGNEPRKSECRGGRDCSSGRRPCVRRRFHRVVSPPATSPADPVGSLGSR